jgi:hypothetical protein
VSELKTFDSNLEKIVWATKLGKIVRNRRYRRRRRKKKKMVVKEISYEDVDWIQHTSRQTL